MLSNGTDNEIYCALSEVNPNNNSFVAIECVFTVILIDDGYTSSKPKSFPMDIIKCQLL